MEELILQENANGKLLNECFTILRPHNATRFVPGREFRIMLNQLYLGQATILDVKTLRLAQINEWIAQIDAGISLSEYLAKVEHAYGFRTEEVFDLILLVRKD